MTYLSPTSHGLSFAGRWVLKRVAMYVGTGLVAAAVFVAGAAFYSFVWPAPPPFVRLLIDPAPANQPAPILPEATQDLLLSVNANPSDLDGASVFISGRLFGTVSTVREFGKPTASVTIEVNPTAGDFLSFDPPEVPKLILLPFSILEWHRDPKAAKKFFAEFRLDTQADGVLTTLAKDVSPKERQK